MKPQRASGGLLSLERSGELESGRKESLLLDSSGSMHILLVSWCFLLARSLAISCLLLVL